MTKIILAILVLSINYSYAHKLPPAVQKIVDEVKLLNGNIETGRNLSKSCTTCHGQSGVPNYALGTSTPYLADQTRTYLAIQLASFKTGDRKFTTMNNVSKVLSSQDMADLIAFYRSVDAKNAHCENVLETNYLGGDFTRGKLLASKEREFSRPDGSTVKISCTMCHGENGLMPEQSRAGTLHPDLAALGEAYVFSTLASFRIGSRVGGPMGIITAQLSDDDLADLAAYYSQLNRCSSF